SSSASSTSPSWRTCSARATTRIRATMPSTSTWPASRASRRRRTRSSWAPSGT
ncbi:unnamed protein product, partial [Prorocentrum cordatum]